jgi:hypothetical protein
MYSKHVCFVFDREQQGTPESQDESNRLGDYGRLCANNFRNGHALRSRGLLKFKVGEP